MLAAGARFGCHVLRDGCLYRLDCHILDGLSVKLSVLAVVPACRDWEQKFLRNTLSVLSCVNSRGGLTFVCVSENMRLGKGLCKGGASCCSCSRETFQSGLDERPHFAPVLEGTIWIGALWSIGVLQIQVVSCDLGQIL